MNKTGFIINTVFLQLLFITNILILLICDSITNYYIHFISDTLIFAQVIAISIVVLKYLRKTYQDKENFIPYNIWVTILVIHIYGIIGNIVIFTLDKISIKAISNDVIILLIALIILILFINQLNKSVSLFKRRDFFSNAIIDTVVTFIPFVLIVFDSNSFGYYINNVEKYFKSNMLYTLLLHLDILLCIVICFYCIFLFICSVYLRGHKGITYITLIVLISVSLLTILYEDVADTNNIYLRLFSLYIIISGIIPFAYFTCKSTDLDETNENEYKLKTTNYTAGIIGPFLQLYLGVLYVFLLFTNNSREYNKYFICFVINLFIIFIRDIFIRIRNFKLEEDIAETANVDALTNTYNRVKFNEIMDNWTGEYTLFFIDIRNFKEINDVYLYQNGNKALIKISNVIRRICNYLDCEYCYCRGYADEFILAVKTIDKNTLEFIKRQFNGITFNTIEEENIIVDLRLDVGYIVNRNNEKVSTLIKKADFAMNKMKLQELDEALEYSGDIEKEFYEVCKLKEDFIEHMKNGLIYPEYETKVCSEKQELVGVEAFCRWNHAEFGFVKPSKFIPVIESIGKIDELDLFMLEEACKFQCKLENIEMDLNVSVNISLNTLRNDMAVDKLIGIPRKYGVRSSSLTLEFSDGVALSNDKEIISRIKKLKRVGFLVAIDQFGMQYSYFGKLSQIYFDEIKIPKHIVRNLENDAYIKIIESIAYLSKKLNIVTAVEGIETATQYNTFKRLGFTNFQGPYFNKSLRECEYIEYIKDKKLKLTLL